VGKAKAVANKVSVAQNTAELGREAACPILPSGEDHSYPDVLSPIGRSVLGHQVHCTRYVYDVNTKPRPPFVLFCRCRRHGRIAIMDVMWKAEVGESQFYRPSPT